MALGCLGLGIFDAWFTRRRLQKYGPDVELNQALAQAQRAGKLETALITRIIVPVATGCLLGVWFGLTIPLAIWLGTKLQVAHFQLISLSLEKHFEKIGSR